MWSLILLGACSAIASVSNVQGSHAAPASNQVERANTARHAPGPLILDRGEGEQEVWFPRDEELVFTVALDLGALGSADVGKVTFTSMVTPFFKDGLVRVEPDDRHLEQALVSMRASGSYTVYSVDQTISTRFLPQSWPKLLHKSVQTGTENRQRELSLGVREGKLQASYRGDGHCKGCEDRAHFLKPTWIWQDEYHCTDCNEAEHRVWKTPKVKDVPPATVDMVTGVMLARTVVQQGRSSASFTLVDQQKLWMVDISRGKGVRRRVDAGKFDAVEVVLKTRPPEGETGREDDFQGLFGLHGNISIWMHPESGVPLEIAGTVPAGPIDLDVRIQLESYRGTPESFRPVV